MEIHIGIDGGGTHARAAAVSGKGEILAVRQGGSLNENNLGREKVREHLHALVQDVLAGCGKNSFSTLTAGLASLDAPGSPELTAALCAPEWDAGKVRLESDAMAALAGGSLGGAGMAVICGTGSMILFSDGHGETQVRGGWGYALGDPGSGYEIAAEAVRRVLGGWEKGKRESGLEEAVLRYFGADSPRGILSGFYRPPFDPAWPAGLARDVLELAGKGEPASLGIVREQMRSLAAQAATLLAGQESLPPVYVYGGVFRHHAWTVDLFAGALEPFGHPEVSFPEFPPEIGAVLLGTGRGQDGQFLQELRESMRKEGTGNA